MFQIGQTLDDRYQLVEALKIAGTRQTWRSIDGTDATACVIKLLGFHPTLQWQDYEQLQREIKMLRSLKSDRIPRYRADFTLDVEGMHWVALVQEEIPGSSLQTLLDQQHRFSEAEIRQIGIDLLQILIDLHGQYPPVLHRDIKPSNLILTPRSVYLVDFGAAQSGAMAIGDFTATGTYGYVPLEQFGGRAVPASDLYAVGATLVHLLTGIHPADLPQHQLKLQFRFLVSIDDRFAQWLEKLLEPDVAQRFQTAKQALTALLQEDAEVKAIAPVSDHLDRSLQLQEAELDRVKISLLENQLQVDIRRRGVHVADVFWLGTGVFTGGLSILMLFSQVHPALSLLCWLDSLPLLGIGLISALGEASLTLSDRSLAIQWRCLGIPYRQVKQTKPAIGIDATASGITIQTENQQYSIGQFSPELNPLESAWLVQQVQAWVVDQRRSVGEWDGRGGFCR